MKFSIISPCYNTEKYIDACVNAVISQTYKNWELLLSDDGSTDNTLNKIRKMEHEDSRIKVFTSSHKGPSAARNIGLNNATGDYLLFLDSDDYISNTHLEHDYSIIKNNSCDMIIHNQHTNFDDTTKKTILLFDYNGEPLSYKEKLMLIFSSSYYLPAATFLTTYRLEFINHNNLRFNSDYHTTEDFDLFMSSIAMKPSIQFADHEYYFYRRNNSNSLTQNMTHEYLMQRLDIFKKWYDYYEGKTIGEFTTVYIQKRISWCILAEIYTWRNMDEKSKNLFKKFYTNNAYLFSKNGVRGSFIYNYYIRPILNKLKL